MYTDRLKTSRKYSLKKTTGNRSNQEYDSRDQETQDKEMHILIKIDQQKTQTIRVYKEDRIGVQIEKQLELPRNATENLYAKTCQDSVNLKSTFKQEDLWSGDEIQLNTKGDGGSQVRGLKELTNPGNELTSMRKTVRRNELNDQEREREARLQK